MDSSQWQEGVVDGRLAGVVSAAGMENGATKTNQDASFLLGRARGSDDFLCGVIDGHGADGHTISKFVRRHLGQEILEHRRAAADRGTRAAIAEGFAGTAEKLRRSRGVAARDSGAVVAVCMRRGQDLYAANVGDTRAVLVCTDRDGRARSEALTRDHTPALPAERDRICAHGGEVAPFFIPGQGFAGPPRVWAQRKAAGGLAVTRAMGDTCLANVGVTAEPDVVKRRVRPCDKFVVLASDGCWDYVSNDRVAELAMQHGTPERASEAIVREARRQWQKDTGRKGYIDDITCLVAKV